jgi:Zn-dependent M28 family amino/carboxypeptidase
MGLCVGCAAGVVETSPSKAPPGEDGTSDPSLPGADSGQPVQGDTGATDSAEPVVALEDMLDRARILEHLDALQAIADLHGDTRQTFGTGFSDSVTYAASVFAEAGYTVTLQDFTMRGFSEDSPPVVEQVSPSPVVYASADLRTLTYSAGGEVQAPLASVDLTLPPSSSPSSTSGCTADDFVGFPVGSVALIQRGSCTFAEKVAQAEAAGAVGVLLFNEGQSGRTDVESWTLDGSVPVGIPVIGTSFSVGNDLAAALSVGAVEVHLVVDGGVVEQTITNVLAEREVGDPDQLVVVGAHLDSVSAGPGINDNGSGTAFVLAAAEAAAAGELVVDRRIRWALWGAEEIGLVGSDYYVSQLSSEELDRHHANLNFDMIGSPNGGRFIYDGDGSATGYAGPAGSDVIEGYFEAWFDSEGLAHAPTAFDGRSDYGPFIWAGIPAGGLFTGAEASMSATEAELFGGRAGEALDACYHQACDSRSNIDEDLLWEMSLAAAHVTGRVAADDGTMGMPGPERVPVARIPAHQLPVGHGHGHGCHPVEL